LRRRKIITLFAIAGSCWQLAARAQQPAKPVRLGYIWFGAKDSEYSTRDGLRKGLRDLGYVEKRDYVLEERYAEGRPERLSDIVTELVRLNVALILSPGIHVTRAVMQGTSTIPIIATGPDLLAAGFVKSLARPEGNVTGLSFTAGVAVTEKWFELLKDTFPAVTTVAMLNSLGGGIFFDRAQAAASALGMTVQHFTAQNPEELDRVLSEIAAVNPGGLIVESDASLVSHRTKIVDFVARHRLPTVYGNLDYIPAGGMLAYYTSIFDTWHRLATYVDRVLKGAKVGDLPVEQTTKFKLVVNLKTAKALRLSIPPSILARADEVIE
jgi:putative ABC transport system substrate-binding protein